MNCVLVLFVFAAISGLCIGEIKRPGYCYVQFPPNGEPEVIEVEKMNKLIAILRRDSLKKFDDYKEEIESLKRQNEDLMNQKQSLEEKMEDINKLMIEEKNELSKLKTTIVELNQSVNDEKQSKSLLQNINLELNQMMIEDKSELSKLKTTIAELNQSIQECCGEIFDQDGTEDIFQASEKGSLNGVKFWYSKDPSSIHAKSGKETNWTPLMYASYYGHLKIVEFVLSKGVDVDAGDYYSNATPLMSASLQGHVPIVKALMDKGAKINHQNRDKWTALHLAVRHNKLSVVKLLIERGADRSLRDSENRTPLDLARDWGYKSIEDYLSSL